MREGHSRGHTKEAHARARERAREAHHARDDNINLPTTCAHEHNNAHPLSDSLPLSLTWRLLLNTALSPRPEVLWYDIFRTIKLLLPIITQALALSASN